MSSFTVNGLRFSGTRVSENRFYFRDLTDWATLPESKSEVRERKQAHGAFGIANDYRASAVFSFHGWYRGVDRRDAELAKDTLKRALGLNRPVLAVLDDDDVGIRQRVVSVRNVPIDDNRRSRVFEFDVDMLATDPLAYGPVVTVTTGPAVSGGGLVWPLGSSGV